MPTQHTIIAQPVLDQLSPRARKHMSEKATAKLARAIVEHAQDFGAITTATLYAQGPSEGKKSFSGETYIFSAAQVDIPLVATITLPDGAPIISKRPDHDHLVFGVVTGVWKPRVFWMPVGPISPQDLDKQAFEALIEDPVVALECAGDPNLSERARVRSLCAVTCGQVSRLMTLYAIIRKRPDPGALTPVCISKISERLGYVRPPHHYKISVPSDRIAEHRARVNGDPVIDDASEAVQDAPRDDTSVEHRDAAPEVAPPEDDPKLEAEWIAEPSPSITLSAHLGDHTRKDLDNGDVIFTLRHCPVRNHRKEGTAFVRYVANMNRVFASCLHPDCCNGGQWSTAALIAAVGPLVSGLPTAPVEAEWIAERSPQPPTPQPPTVDGDEDQLSELGRARVYLAGILPDEGDPRSPVAHNLAVDVLAAARAHNLSLSDAETLAERVLELVSKARAHVESIADWLVRKPNGAVVGVVQGVDSTDAMDTLLRLRGLSTVGELLVDLGCRRLVFCRLAIDYEVSA